MNRQFRLKIVFVVTALILILVIVYSGLRILESTVFYGQEKEFRVKTKTIVRDGVRYYPRQDINVILVMGINQPGYAVPENPNEGNAVDMLALVVFDEKAGEYTVLNLNRDIMLDVPALNEKGVEIGSVYTQLAYAHTYGTGVEDSCENTRKAVSNFLGGITIDYYVSMNIDAVSLLNDAVGGVTVNVTEDLSAVDPSIPLGEVTLRGRQAQSYVQSRWYVEDELNLSRIERQKKYMDSYITAFRQTVKTSDAGFVLNTYNSVAPYLISDLPISTLTGMVERYIDYPLTGVISLEGENRIVNNMCEFYVDERKLEDLRLELFYAPK